MKKRFLSIILVALTASSFITGCGNNEYNAEGLNAEDQAVISDMQQELKDDEEEAALQEEEIAEVAEDTFKLYDVLPEMEQSNYNDGIVQVNDVILKTDGTATIQETIDVLKASVDGDKLQFYYEDHDLRLSEYSPDGIVEGNNWLTIVVAYGDIENAKELELCRISAFNLSEETASCQDALVISVEACCWTDAPYAFNIWYAGNINVGLNDKQYKDSEYYGQNTDQVALTYTTVEDYLAGKGELNALYNEDYHCFKTKRVIYMEDSVYFTISRSISIDEATGEVSSISDSLCLKDSFESKLNNCIPVLNSISDMDDENWTYLSNIVLGKLQENSSLLDAELLGTALCTNDTVEMVFKANYSDDSTIYYCIPFKYIILCADNQPVCDAVTLEYQYDSMEELLNTWHIEQGNSEVKDSTVPITD